MCGRFALGVNAHDLETGTQRDYFARAPTASASSPPAPSADNHHHQDHQHQQSSSTTDTTTQHPIQWASLESQSAFRPRFNVRPLSPSSSLAFRSPSLSLHAGRTDDQGPRPQA